MKTSHYAITRHVIRTLLGVLMVVVALVCGTMQAPSSSVGDKGRSVAFSAGDSSSGPSVGQSLSRDSEMQVKANDLPDQRSRKAGVREPRPSERGRADLISLASFSSPSPGSQGPNACPGNLIITGNVFYAEPGCSDGSLYSSKTQNTQCYYSVLTSPSESSPLIPAAECTDLPLRRARVELWTGYYFLFATRTDEFGHFEFCLNNSPDNPVDLYVVIVMCPDGSNDGDACGSLTGVPKPFSVAAGPSTDAIYIIDLFSNPAYDVCIGTVNWDIIDRRTNPSGAENVYDLLANDAFDYLQTEVSWTNDRGLWVAFPDGPTDFSPSPLALHIATGDEQDPDVVLKTYSEFVLYELYEHVLPATTPDCAFHVWGLPSDPGCAMIHGTATFLQAAMQDDWLFEDTPSPGLPPAVQIDMEAPDPPVASNSDEGAVAASFWDMYDSINEGHDVMSVGLPPIWNVIEQANPTDFCEFVQAYVAAHGSSQELDDILIHHTVGCAICAIPNSAAARAVTAFTSENATREGTRVALTTLLPLVRETRLTTQNPVSKPDLEGNRFYITWEGCYICLQYKPASGPALMVGKCPWKGGCNTFKLFYVALAGLDRPSAWLQSDHTSYDFDPNNPSCDCNNKGGNVYQDDYPDPPGYFDWVTHGYGVCEDVLKVTHYRDAGPDLHQPELDDRVYEGPGVVGCSGTAFPPSISCTIVLASALPDSTMGVVHTDIALAGDPNGGTITLAAGSRSVSITSNDFNTLSDVANAMALAINTAPEFAPAGVIASANGSILTLEGIGREDLSITTDDPGIVQPAAPADFIMVDVGSEVMLSWINTDLYDDLQLTKGNRVVALNIPGVATSCMDSLLLSWPGDYLLVGWKNGMPSEAVLATSVTAISDPSPRHLHLTVRTYPNPLNPSTRIVFELPRSQDVSLVIYDVRGRRVRQLLRGPKIAGSHIVEWDGKNDDGEILPSGVYLYELIAGDSRRTGKMTLLK